MIYPDLDKYIASEEKKKKHNEETLKIWKAYQDDEPIRVPTEWGALDPKRFIYNDESLSFKKYALDANETLRLQALSQYYNSKIIMQDGIYSEPESWNCMLQHHGLDEAFWGCEVKYTDRQQPKIIHNHNIDVYGLQSPDPTESPFMQHMFKIYEEMKELVLQNEYYGKRFDPNVSTHTMNYHYGVFNVALQLMGDRVFLEMYENPEQLKEFFMKIGKSFVQRTKAWKKIGEAALKLDNDKGKQVGNTPINLEFRGVGKNGLQVISYDEALNRTITYDHGIDMISLQHYQEFLVPVYQKMKEQFGYDKYDEMIEYCGRRHDLVIYMHEHFGIKRFCNINSSFHDIEKLRHDLGDEVELRITIAPEVVLNGPSERIIKEVKETLTPAVKGKGRLIFGLQIDNFTAPIENLLTLYEAVKEYGHY